MIQLHLQQNAGYHININDDNDHEYIYCCFPFTYLICTFTSNQSMGEIRHQHILYFSMSLCHVLPPHQPSHIPSFILIFFQLVCGCFTFALSCTFMVTWQFMQQLFPSPSHVQHGEFFLITSTHVNIIFEDFLGNMLETSNRIYNNLFTPVPIKVHWK